MDSGATTVARGDKESSGKKEKSKKSKKGDKKPKQPMSRAELVQDRDMDLVPFVLKPYELAWHLRTRFSFFFLSLSSSCSLSAYSKISVCHAPRRRLPMIGLKGL